MPHSRSARGRTLAWLPIFLACLLGATLSPSPSVAQKVVGSEILSGIVGVASEVPPEARTAATLGTQREGSGIVIDDAGLVLTIGYLIMESVSAEVIVDGKRRVPASFVAYDHDSGLGLLRASRPLGVRPIELGDSNELVRGKPVLVASQGGEQAAIGAFVVSRRDFAGWWEYLLENAVFTSPPHPSFGGAALLDEKGRLVGVGSLIVADAADEDVTLPGNMFVPVNVLKPILADLITTGRSGRPPRPWLGLYPQELHGRLLVARVPADGPADRAGLKSGDLVLRVAGKTVKTVPDYYRAIWSLGPAGVEVPITVLRDAEPTEITLRSIDRYSWFKMRPSY